MSDVFVKIDGENKKLKIQSKEEESFKKISIGGVTKETLEEIFLKALDDSDMQSPSTQIEIDTEQNFWKHFFQQKDIDSDSSIDPILKNYIELFLKNLEEEKDNLTKKEKKIEKLEDGPQELLTLPTTESSETTPLKSTKLLELQKARIEWLQNSISIDNNKDRINKLMKVISKISFDGKGDLINKIKEENTSFEINDQKLNEALIDAYCSIIGKKDISKKISKELLKKLPGVNVKGEEFKETLQKYVNSLGTQQDKDTMYQLLKTDYDYITQIPQDKYLDNITDDKLGDIKNEIISSQGIEDEKGKKEISSKTMEEIKTFLIRNPQIINECYEGLHVNADIDENNRTIKITDVKEYGLGNKIGLKSGDVIEIADEVGINEAIISIRNFNHRFIKTIKSNEDAHKKGVIDELKKIKLQSYDNTRSHLLSDYYNPNPKRESEAVKKIIDDIGRKITDIEKDNKIQECKDKIKELEDKLEAAKNKEALSQESIEQIVLDLATPRNADQPKKTSSPPLPPLPPPPPRPPKRPPPTPPGSTSFNPPARTPQTPREEQQESAWGDDGLSSQSSSQLLPPSQVPKGQLLPLQVQLPPLPLSLLPPKGLTLQPPRPPNGPPPPPGRRALLNPSPPTPRAPNGPPPPPTPRAQLKEIELQDGPTPRIIDDELSSQSSSPRSDGEGPSPNPKAPTGSTTISTLLR